MHRPHPDRLISERLAEVEPVEWTGDVWRHTLAGYPPDRRNVHGARWNPPGVEALYVSLERDTAIAEGDYLIASQPLRPAAKRTVHRLRISLSALVDLTDPVLLEALGVDQDALTSDDHRACQAVGAAAVFLHLDGILVPSARHPGANIVILFTAGDVAPEIDVLDSQTL